MSKKIKKILEKINWKFLILELVSVIIPILFLFLWDIKWFEASILGITFFSKMIYYQKSDVSVLILKTKKVEKIVSEKTTIENSNVEKIDSRTTNVEIISSNTTLSNTHTPESENEKLLQEFYQLMKAKKWEDIYEFLSYNQDERILSKYFREIQQAKSFDQSNLNTRNNKYNIKIQEEMQINDRHQKTTLKIGENGFDNIWENMLKDIRHTYQKFVIDKEYEIDHLKSFIENNKIHELFKNRERLLKVFPDELFRRAPRDKGTESKARIKLNSNCAFGIYKDSAQGKAYRMTVDSLLIFTQNTFFFEKNGDCFVSGGNSLRPINKKERGFFMKQIWAIFEELKKDILD